jgi:hypothetical protein
VNLANVGDEVKGDNLLTVVLLLALEIFPRSNDDRIVDELRLRQGGEFATLQIQPESG